MKILITGVAGFIGFHAALSCLNRGDIVIGIDNINDYYDPKLKIDRLNYLHEYSIEINKEENFNFIKGDISKEDELKKCFEESIDSVINLAAQAGVRKSLDDPLAYIESNVKGFVNILEACSHNNISHLVYASTSSVYGLNSNMPFSESDNTDHPIQLYAATKKSNEILAHSYSHLFELPSTGLRFFTVYGPWGRPDMALFLFTKAIAEGKPIDVFNKGNHTRDFTFVDDIVNGILLALDNPPSVNTSWQSNNPDSSTSSAPFRILNIGNGERVELNDYIKEIEINLGQKAKKNLLPLQPGDIPDSLSDITQLNRLTGYRPKTSYKEGVSRFIKWYKEYYQID